LPVLSALCLSPRGTPPPESPPFNVHLLFLLVAVHPVKLAQNWKTGLAMVVRVATVAFEGIEARPVDVQV
jgi:hypothetical protein